METSNAQPSPPGRAPSRGRRSSSYSLNTYAKPKLGPYRGVIEECCADRRADAIRSRSPTHLAVNARHQLDRRGIGPKGTGSASGSGPGSRPGYGKGSLGTGFAEVSRSPSNCDAQGRGSTQFSRRPIQSSYSGVRSVGASSRLPIMTSASSSRTDVTRPPQVRQKLRPP